MPIYTYVCAHCKHEYEQLVKSHKSRPPRKCPKCDKGGRQERQISTGNLRFKGAGFYCNDYPRNKKRR